MAMELVKPKMLAVDEYCSPWAVELQTSDSLSSIKLYLLIGESSSSFNCNHSCMLFPLKCCPSAHRMLNAYGTNRASLFSSKFIISIGRFSSMFDSLMFFVL